MSKGQNNSLDLKLSFPDEENNISQNSSTFYQNPNHSQSTTSIDLNKFKITTNKNPSIDPYETFNPSTLKQIQQIQNKENFQTQNAIKPFKPYSVENFLGKSSNGSNKNAIQKTIPNTHTVNNISAISSNYKYLLLAKKLEEEEKKKIELKDPSFFFNEKYHHESRRMIVEYLKTIITRNPEKKQKISNILQEKNISPLVLQKKRPVVPEKNIKRQTSTASKQTNQRGSDITLGDSIISVQNSDTANFSVHNFTSKTNISNSLKLVDTFLTNMDDDSFEKISLLTFLTIPRLMNMIITNYQKIPFIFSATPSSISCSFGIESYIFKWNDCKTYKSIGSFDLINVDTCSINVNNKAQFDIIISTNNGGECFSYSIEAENEQNARSYVNSINFVSQLIKCRAFIRKKK